jgi:hypothetical protein
MGARGRALYDKITTTDGIDGWTPMIRTLYQYWDHKRAGRLMPRRADIDPADFINHLPHILLVDVHRNPDRFTYRVVGTGEVKVRGRDPTGRDVAEAYYGPSREDALSCYSFVRDNRAFLLDPEPFIGPDGKYNQGEVLFLPLSEDGQWVNRILVYVNVTRIAW